MAKVGDKFIIEIGEVFTAKGTYMAYGCEKNEYEENMYRVKGIDWLIFDEKDMGKLEKYEPQEEEKPSPVNVGDEVEDSSGARWFVTFLCGMTGGGHAVSGVGLDGRIHSTKVTEVKRTGRRNWHIVEALAWRPPVEML